MHNMIDIVEKKLSNITGGSLSLKCKDFRVVKLDISSTEDLNNVATTLESLSSISNYRYFIRLLKSVATRLHFSVRCKTVIREAIVFNHDLNFSNKHVTKTNCWSLQCFSSHNTR